MNVPPATNASARKYEVTPLELLFDLVFVFAVLQLSHHLQAHLSWRGAAETLVMLLAVFAVWLYTSWAATLLPTDRPGTRWMVLAVMLLGLFMHASVTRAFSTSGWAFVVPFLLIQLGRACWTLVNAPDAVYREQFFRVLIWFLSTAPLWLAGAAVGPEGRLLWWGTAAGLDLVGTWLAQPIPGRRLRSQNVRFESGHMVERLHLFLLVALGETVLSTGMAIAEAPPTVMSLITGTAALAGTVALWALGFGPVDRLAVRYAEETRDPVRASRHAANALMLMVAGLIAVAVGNEHVIAHPHGHTSAPLSALLFGGPMVFLAAQGWYLWAVPQVSPRRRLTGSAALALVGFVALAVPLFVALLLAAGSLTGIAAVEWHRQMRPAKL